VLAEHGDESSMTAARRIRKKCFIRRDGNVKMGWKCIVWKFSQYPPPKTLLALNSAAQPLADYLLIICRLFAGSSLSSNGVPGSLRIHDLAI
jgi:hypothetical protein